MDTLCVLPQYSITYGVLWYNPCFPYGVRIQEQTRQVVQTWKLSLEILTYLLFGELYKESHCPPRCLSQGSSYHSNRALLVWPLPWQCNSTRYYHHLILEAIGYSKSQHLQQLNYFREIARRWISAFFAEFIRSVLYTLANLGQRITLSRLTQPLVYFVNPTVQSVGIWVWQNMPRPFQGQPDPGRWGSFLKQLLIRHGTPAGRHTRSRPAFSICHIDNIAVEEVARILRKRGSTK